MYGLVLEGGGAKGAYHIGAYKAINELGLNISGISGTSIGAINGALIAGKDLEYVYDLWYNLKPSQIFDVNEEVVKELREFNFNQKNVNYMINKIKEIFNNGGIELNKIRSFLAENINEKKIRNTDIDFGIVTVNISQKKAMELFIEDIPKGKLLDYLIASAYLPTFKMEKIDGDLFLDGGFYDNLPINLLAKKGYKKIIAIRTFGIGRVRKIKNKDLKITYISPNEDLGRTLDFDQEQIRYNLKLGYFDTLKVFNDLKGKKYYLNVDKKEKDYIELLLKLNQEQLARIGKILNIKGLTGYRMLFEEAIAKLSVLLDLDEQSNYEDILLSLLEFIAEKIDIERFKVYNLDDFIKQIKEAFPENKTLESNNIPSFIKDNKLLSRTVKDALLEDIITVIFN
jgi:NTE family protein